MRSRNSTSSFLARGFTLLELLVTVAIAAVLLAVALPNVRNQILASQARQTARSVKDALDYARQYALDTSTVTTFTPNGCGYTVTAANGAAATPLTSSAGVSGWAIECAGNLRTVSFLGDGSACTPNPGANACQPLANSRTFSASGGGSTWIVILRPSGLTTP